MSGVGDLAVASMTAGSKRINTEVYTRCQGGGREGEGVCVK